MGFGENEPTNGAHYDVNFNAPSIFFNVATCLGAFIAASFTGFVALSACGRTPTCVPKFALPFRDPIVLSLLGATTLGLCVQLLGILCRYIEPVCVYGFRIVSGTYVLSYFCVNLFLLAKLRAVDAGLRAGWYHKVQKLVTIVTKIGMPAFAVVVFATTKGAYLYGQEGTYFCVDFVPWAITVTFAVLQGGAGLAYLLLFIMPLISTEKHVMSVVNSRSTSSLRPLIIRNLTSCVISIITTFVAMVGMSFAHVSRSPLPSAWTISPPFIDLTVNLCALMYAVKPAWKRQSGSDDSHASTRRNTVAEKANSPTPTRTGHMHHGSIVTGRSALSNTYNSSTAMDRTPNAAGRFAAKHHRDTMGSRGVMIVGGGGSNRGSVELEPNGFNRPQLHHLDSVCAENPGSVAEKEPENPGSVAEKEQEQDRAREHSVSISESELNLSSVNVAKEPALSSGTSKDAPLNSTSLILKDISLSSATSVDLEDKSAEATGRSSTSSSASSASSASSSASSASSSASSASLPVSTLSPTSANLVRKLSPRPFSRPKSITNAPITIAEDVDIVVDE